MLEFIQQNHATVITVAVLLTAVALAIRKIVKDKKKGIGPCGQRCSECKSACKYYDKE